MKSDGDETVPGAAEHQPLAGQEPDATRPPRETRAESVELPSELSLERIGEYDLVRELARGGMGVVYVARHTRLDRQVALKVLKSGSFAGPEALERFRVEARAAARLRHPGIVGIHQVGEDAGLHYLVMDLIEGESLQSRVRREGSLEPREAARIASALARALEYAHSRSVLHRDVKPANVLMTNEGEPILTDFGLAKEIDRGKEGITRSGQVMGTPAYMPPEQANGELDRVDRRADVYSLGATLYELLTGRPPFDGPSAINVILAVLTEDPLPPSRLRPEVDRDLETICLECLEKEPERRYSTAGALADDLDRYLRDEPIHARRPGLALRLRKWRRRNPTLALGLTALGLAFAVAAGLGWATQLQDLDEQLHMRRQRAEFGRQALEDAIEIALGPDLEGSPRLGAVRERLLGRAVGDLLEYRRLLRVDLSPDMAWTWEARVNDDLVDVMPDLMAQLDSEQRAIEAHPRDPAAHRAVCASLERLGVLLGAYEQRMELDMARETYERALASRRAVAGLEAGSPESLRELALTLVEVARVRLEADDAAGALKAGQEASELLVQRIEGGVADMSDRLYRTRALYQAGRAALALGRHDTVREALEQALENDKALVRLDPTFESEASLLEAGLDRRPRKTE